MTKSKYRHILKVRIKEMGYTQQEFADKIGIPYETFKNILRGSGKYTVELLEVFSRELDCSYDYLMGYSSTPYRDLQTVKDKINLSDETIRLLQNLTEQEDSSEKLAVFKTLDSLINDRVFMEYATAYLYSDETMKLLDEAIFSYLEEADPEYERPSFSSVDSLLTGMIKELILLKNNLPQ